MCREQLPVWQQFHEDNRDRNVEVLSVAMDAQGPDKARPYVEKAGTEFTTVVDEANLLGDLYGFKAIPNGYLIDEQGVVRYKKLGGFDIRRDETAEVVERWVSGPSLDESLAEAEESLGAEHSEANTLFRRGLDLYRDGKVEEALARWREGFELEPDNLIIRKQVWAVENPEKFYDGDVDYGWQREQMEKGL
ncbi:MAG: redoxin domain-containing protein [Chloroflexi bacterium]|nr:redoxin domain-containing protein [Chloroflexota bacterium]